MEFESVKEWIVYLDTHPYILANNMRIFCQGFMPVLKEICRMVEQKLDDETFEFTLNEEDQKILGHGLLLLPALILEEVDQEAFSIYEAIIVLVQNYSLMFNDEQYLELISNLSKLVLMKNSLSTLLLQCESLIIQQQGVINNSATPYKLSHQFLTSLLKDESSC